MIYTNATLEDIESYAKVLVELLPKQEIEPVYSKGFVIFNKMPKKQRMALCALHGYNQSKAIDFLNQQLENI